MTVKPYCYLNRKIVPLAKAGLSLSDLGILRGYGVFDFLRTYNGKLFYFHEHFSRFKRSAQAVGLRVPESETYMREIISTLFKKNRVQDASIRMVLTGGPSSDGFSFSGTPSSFVLIEDLHQFPASVFMKGAKIFTYEYERSSPEAKTTHYATALALAPQKKRAGAIEILYTRGGFVLEASTSNIFLVKKGHLITPERGILLGVTRGIVLSLARKLDLICECRAVHETELFSADEVFLTATNKEVTPIVAINGKKIGGGKVGPISRRLLTAYRELTRVY